jgi:iron complex outermembrane receptor protein
MFTPVKILWADNHDTVEADFFDDAPLILTASRMSKPLQESPASVSIITHQMIESSGARKVSELFRLVPGFIVGNFNGNKPVVTYQGLGDEFMRSMQVLIDGRSVFIPSFGGVPWNNLPLLLEDIERIEVIRGPNAVTYGANAFLATINIITRHAAEDFGARYSITASDNSNPDINDAYLRLGYHYEDLDWRLSLGTLHDDGFADVNDSRDIHKANFRLDYLSRHNQSWTFQLGSSDITRGEGFPNEPTRIERDTEATNSYLNILWEANSTSSVSSVRLTHTEQEVIDNFPADPSGGIIVFIDFGRISQRTDLELIRSQKINDRYRIVYGGNIRKDKVKSLFLLNDLSFHEIDTSRIFTALEWRPDQNWLLDFGVTLEDTSLTDREYSPRLSVIRNLTSEHALRFVASRAKRNPILYELEGETIFTADIPLLSLTNVDIQLWQGNLEIKPEDIISYELGLRSRLNKSSISSDVKLFSYEITDHLVRVDSSSTNLLGDPIETSANQDSTRVNGLELAFDFSPIPKLGIKTGFSIVNVDSTSLNFENSFPDKTAFISGDYQWNPIHNFSASFYYIDEMKWLGSPSGNIIQPIRKLDLRYAYTLDSKSETRIELIGQNLLEDYNDYTLQNLAEPVFLLRISGGF